MAITGSELLAKYEERKKKKKDETVVPSSASTSTMTGADLLKKYEERKKASSAPQYEDDLTEEKIAERRALYQSNADRIADLETTYKDASKISQAIYDRSNALLYGAQRGGNIRATMDEATANDATIAELKKQLETYGDVDALKKEMEELKSANLRYQREQKVLDDYFVPRTEEFLQNAAYRDYGNPTIDDIEAYYKGTDLAPTELADKLGFYLNDYSSIHDEILARQNNAISKGEDYRTVMPAEYVGLAQEGRDGSWEYLKDNEIDIYYNLLKTEGQEAAYKFLDAMQTTLNKRATQEMAKQVADAGVGAQIAYNVASIPANVFGGAGSFIDDALHMIRGEDINPYSYAHRWQNFAQAVRQDTASDINEATGGAALPFVGTTFGDVYQALMSGVDSAVGIGLGGTTYGILMGMGAASSEAKELYEKGASMGQIAAGGILAGAAEMVFEKYSIDKFVKMGDTKTVATIFVNALKQGGVEASEEVLTEIANTLSDAVVMGSQSDWQGYIDKYIAEGYSESEATVKALFNDVAPNVINAGIGGLISGGAMGSLGSTGSYFNYQNRLKSHGQSIIDRGGVDTVKALADDMAGVKAVSKASSKVGSKASAKNVGGLSVAIEEAMSAQNKADIESALVEKGLSKTEAKRVAVYLTSTAELTEEQQSEIKNNKQVAEVVTELVKNSSSVLNQRKLNLMAARLGVKLNDKKATTTGEVAVNKELNLKDKISAKKQTTNEATGEAIVIDKNNAIAKVEDGKVYYNTDKGVVPLTDVTYASEEEGVLYEGLSDLNPAIANALISNYDGKISARAYVNGAREGILLYGKNNFQAVGKDIPTDTYFADLSEADQAFALKLGKTYSKMEAEQKGENLKTAIKNAAERAEADKSSGKQIAEGKIRFESNVDGGKLNRTQRRTVSLAKHLAKAIGIDIVFYDATKAGTKHNDSNGYFDPKDNSIHLDLQNAATDSKTIAFTLSHELVHFIKKWSPAKFKAFADFLMEQYAVHGVSTSTLLANKMAALNTTDADYAYEEMIADACERMLLDSNAVVKLMELRKSDLELFEKVKLHILQLLNKIRNAFKGVDPNTEEGIALQKMEDVLGKLHEMFEEAAVDAVKTYQAAQKNAAEIVFGESTVSEGEYDTSVKNQLKDSAKIGNASIAYNEKHRNVNAAVLKVGVDTMIEMAETMMPYLEQEGILPPDIPGKTIFKNGSYGRTGENTTLCVRTLTYEDFKDRVADELGRPLTVAESLLVSQKIYDIATDPQCIYCYVAADRKAYDEYLGEYHKAMDKYIKAMRDGGDVEALYEEYLDGRKDTAAQQKRWAMWKSIANSGKDYISAKDLSTRANRDKVIATKGDFATQVKDAQRYAQSASWAKTVSDYRAYKGDILKLTQSLVDTLNSEYGLRMYSFSDYTPAFIVENMQMIIDASARGLKSLAYTKDTAYAKIFAPTGQAINVSCFAKYDSKTGTYVEDNRQGASWTETKQLRDKFHNVGAVMVCTNDAMVEWAMRQDWVDVVVPYHIVKTGTTIANEYAWRNYTAESSDRAGNKTANIYPTEHNNDFATYQKLIEERGITPRFDRFYQRALNGDFTKEQYMKLVNEVRLPASELSAVVPMFDLVEAKKSFGVDENGDVIEGGFVDKGGYMGGWYRAGVDVNQEVLAVKKDIEDGKSSLDVDYGMNKQLKEKQSDKYGIKKQVKRATDKDYLDAVNRGDMETAQRMVDEAAREAGYSTEHLYHGTSMFGFTDIDVSSASDDSISFFATNRQEVASGYMPWYEDDASDRYHNDVRRIGVPDKSRPRGLSRSYDAERILTEARKVFPEYKDARVATDAEILTDLKTYWLTETIEAAEKLRDIELSIGSNKLRQQVRDMCDAVITASKEDTLDAWKVVGNRYKEFDGINIPYDANDMRPQIFRSRILSGLQRIETLSKTTAIMLNGQLTSTASIVDSYNSFLGGETLGMYDLYAKQDNQLVIQGRGSSWDQLPLGKHEAEYRAWLGEDASSDSASKRVTTRDIAAFAKAKGYRSVAFFDIYDNGVYGSAADISDVYAFFHPNEDVKSADPVTYDDEGNVIPLSERFNAKNDDIRYQKKPVSIRELLANALESEAKEGDERNALRNYKTNLRALEAEQKRLDDVRSQLRNLRKKASRTVAENKQIEALEVEAKRIHNRINAYEKELVKLESSKHIKSVLQREKEQTRKNYEQRGKEALSKYSKASADEVTELRRKYEESRKRGIESRSKTKLKGDTRKLVRNLTSLLKNGNKKRNIKEDEQGVVASALALAEILLADDITNEDIVTIGVDDALDSESVLLNEYRDLITQRDDYLAEIDSYNANGVVNESDEGKTSNARDEVEKIKRRISELNRELASVFERERTRLNRSTIDNMINDLIAEYSVLAKSDKAYIKNAYREEVKDRLANLKTSLGDKIARDMDIYQLTELYDTLKMIEKMVRVSNKLFIDGKLEDLKSKVSAVEDEVMSATDTPKEYGTVVSTLESAFREFSWNNLRPIDAFERLGSPTLEKLFWDFVDGMTKAGQIIRETGEAIYEARTKYGYSKWKLNEVSKTFTTRDGLVFKPTLADKLSIYAYSQREQAEKHMLDGGFVFDTGATYKEVENGKTYVRKKLSQTYRMDDITIGSIIASLTQEQRDYVDAILPIFTALGEMGNEVSDVMYGIDLFKEKVYFPLKTSADYRSSTSETLNSTPTMSSMTNSGFTKQTVPNADNAIVLRAFDDVTVEHIEKMANWVSLVLPIENLRKVFENVSREEDRNSKSIKSLIGERYGVEAQKYFEQWITDINGGVVPQGAKSFLGKMFSRAKAMSVSANLSVVAQQYSSIFRAMELVDPKYFTPFINKEARVSDEKAYDELIKYAPITIIKEMGGFDVGSGHNAKSYIGDKGARMDAKHIGRKIGDVSMWGASLMDKLGWVTIWKAIKAEVAKEQKLKVGTDEFFEACKKRFTEVIVKTQVFDSVASRSGYMRSQNDLVKFSTSFLGEPTAIMGRTFVSTHNLIRAIKSGDKAEIKSAAAHFGRTMSVIAVSGTLANLAKALIYAGRDDDEDKAFIEKWSSNFAEALESDLNPLNSLPFTRDIMSAIEGWDVERPDMTLIAELVTSIKRMLDGEPTLDDSLNLTGSVGNFFGIPLKNVIREIKSVITVVDDIFDDVKPADVSGAFIEGITGKKRSTTELLYRATVNKDKGKVNAIRSGYKTESAYLTALRTALRENDPRIAEAAKARINGNIAEYTRIARLIIAEGNFSQDIIVGAINSEINAIKASEPSETTEVKAEKALTIYSANDINLAFDNDNNALATSIIKELIDTKVANGMEEKNAKSSVRSSMTSYWKPLYIAAYKANNQDEMYRIRMILKTSGIYGSAADVINTCRGWLNEK